jgi:hypothetical protein
MRKNERKKPKLKLKKRVLRRLNWDQLDDAVGGAQGPPAPTLERCFSYDCTYNHQSGVNHNQTLRMRVA